MTTHSDPTCDHGRTEKETCIEWPCHRYASSAPPHPTEVGEAVAKPVAHAYFDNNGHWHFTRNKTRMDAFPLYPHPSSFIHPAHVPVDTALRVLEDMALNGITLTGDDISRLHAIADRIAPTANSAEGKVEDAFKAGVNWALENAMVSVIEPDNEATKYARRAMLNATASTSRGS